MAEEKKPWNWGKPFGIISLVFGVIAVHFVFYFLATSIFISTNGSAVPSDSSYSQMLSTLFATFTYAIGITSIIAILFSIPGIIGSASKRNSILGTVFGWLSLFFFIYAFTVMTNSIH